MVLQAVPIARQVVSTLFRVELLAQLANTGNTAVQLEQQYAKNAKLEVSTIKEDNKTVLYVRPVLSNQELVTPLANNAKLVNFRHPKVQVHVKLAR